MKLHKDKQAMELLITNISGRTGVRRDVLEKDYYVTLLLKELTTKKDQNFSYFKGGTALYKALKSVRRFSEDIDLTVYVSDLDSQSQKQKRLNMLYEEKNKLEIIKNKKDTADKKAQTLQSAYVVICKNIKDLDDHLEDIKKQISSFKHQQFLRFEEQFQKELNNELLNIKKQQKFIDSLQEDKTYLLFGDDPTKVKDIDNQLYNENLKLNKIIENYDNINRDYENFLKQNDNAVIKSLIEEGSFFEINIPKLKELAIKLKTKINNLVEESHKMQEALREYQTILMQIQELENESCSDISWCSVLSFKVFIVKFYMHNLLTFT